MRRRGIRLGASAAVMVTAQRTGSAMRWTDHNSSPAGDRILVLSTNGCAGPVATLIKQAEQLGWPIVNHAAAGVALRQIGLIRPSGLLILLDEQQAIEKTTDLISDLRRYQPALPLVAVAPHHNDEAERRLRIAGATAYLSGNTGTVITMAAELIWSARLQREPPEQGPRVLAARSPPKLRGRRAPPPRIRGQP